jgi:hypothetical protein
MIYLRFSSEKDFIMDAQFFTTDGFEISINPKTNTFCLMRDNNTIIAGSLDDNDALRRAGEISEEAYSYLVGTHPNLSVIGQALADIGDDPILIAIEKLQAGEELDDADLAALASLDEESKQAMWRFLKLDELNLG